jgi:hypothetical protein
MQLFQDLQTFIEPSVVDEITRRFRKPSAATDENQRRQHLKSNAESPLDGRILHEIAA